MTITPKTKSQVDKGILTALKTFKETKAWKGHSNVTLSQYIQNIIRPFMEPHAPVRTSYEYQLFLSIARDTPTYPNFLKTN